MDSDLKRDSVIRKSIRLPNKRMAPAPPTQQPLSSQSKTLDCTDGSDNRNTAVTMTSINSNNNSNFNNNPNNNEILRSPAPPIIQRKLIFPTEQSENNGSSSVYRVEIKDKGNLKLSDILPETKSTNNNPYGYVKMDPIKDIKKMDDQKQRGVGEDDDYLGNKALSDLQAQINNMIINTNQINNVGGTNDRSGPIGTVGGGGGDDDNNSSPIDGTISPMLYKKRSKRYGEQQDLLNTGISDMASGTGLAYIEPHPDDEDNPIEFKRGVDGRNSTGGAMSFTSKFLPKPKPTKPVVRTSSDTKSIEQTIQLLRARTREMKNNRIQGEMTTTTTTNQQSTAVPPIKILHTHNQDNNNRDIMTSTSSTSSNTTSISSSSQRTSPQIKQVSSSQNHQQQFKVKFKLGHIRFVFLRVVNYNFDINERK